MADSLITIQLVIHNILPIFQHAKVSNARDLYYPLLYEDRFRPGTRHLSAAMVTEHTGPADKSLNSTSQFSSVLFVSVLLSWLLLVIIVILVSLEP